MAPEREMPALDPSAHRALLEARAKRYADALREAATVVGAAMSFRRGQTVYAAALECLKGVRPVSGFCPMLGASAVVPGVVHHRGEILSMHDLAAYVGARAEHEAEWMLVLEDRDERIALLCDEMLDVVMLEEGKLQPVPVTFGEAADCFLGLYAGHTLLLDVPRLFVTPQFMDAY